MTDAPAPTTQPDTPSADTLVVVPPVDSAPKIEVIARAIDVEGKNPCRVIEGRNHLDLVIRLLLPEEQACSKQRVTNALIRAGFDCGTPAETSTIVEHVMAASPSLIAMYVDHDGWHHDYSAFVLADKVYTATRVFPRYIEGVVEAVVATGKLEEHLDALKAFSHPIEIAAVGAVLAGLVAPLVGYGPLVVALSDATPDEAARVMSAARSIFGTQCHDLVQVHQLNGASEAAHVAAAIAPKPRVKTKGSVGRAVFGENGASYFALAVADKLAAAELAEALAPSCQLVIPANAGSTSTSAKSAAQGCVATEHELRKFHGSVGDAFVAALIKNRESVVQKAGKLVPQYRDTYARQLGVAVDDSAAMQTLTFVALLRFALSCANHFKVRPWPTDVVDAAMREISARCHSYHVKREHVFVREVIKAVKDQAHDCARVVKGRQLLLIEAPLFDKYVVAHRDKSRVLTVLRENQLLVTTKGNPTQYQVRQPEKTNADARQWVYAIDAAVLKRF